MASVLLCSDEPILSEGTRFILAGFKEFECYSYRPRLLDVAYAIEEHRPDLLLVALTSEVTFEALSELQKTNCQPKIVLWVHSISTELALQAMSLGVRGILRRAVPAETLVECLTRVNQGELWFEKSLMDSISNARRYTLTPREGQLVSLLSQGLKNKEIADLLTISEGTVKVYLSRLFQKLGVKDRFELALYSLKNLNSGSGNLEIAPTGNRNTNPPSWQPPRSFFVEGLLTRAQHAR